MLSIGTNYTIEAGRRYTVTSAFTKLYLRDNNLTELNVTAMTNLTELGFQFNSLTTIDVSTLTQLPYLDCSHNKLTQLNLNGLSKLETVWTNNNYLTDLNLSGLDSLTAVYCFTNQFSVCDLDRMFTSLPTKAVADNAKIYIADGSIANDTLNRCRTPIANGKNWTVANFSGNRTIANTTFNCNAIDPQSFTFKSSGTTFRLNTDTENTGNITISPALPNGNTSLSIGTNYTIEAERTYTVTSAFTKLFLRDNYLTELNITAMTNLTELGFQFNSLTNIDVSTLTQLTYLDGSHNQFTQLNPYGLSKLKTIWANNNQISDLNLSGLDSLTKVCCYKNQFSVCGLDLLFTSLPTKEDADNAKIYIADGGNIQNDTINRCRIPIATGKNWTVLNFSGNRPIANTTFSCDATAPQSFTFKSSDTTFKLNSYTETTGNIIISPALANGDTLLSIGTNYTIEAERTYTVTSAFTKLYLRDNNLTELNVTAMTNLTELGFQFNSLTNIDVSTLTQLPYLDCSNNKLTQLNLNGLSKLETVWANNNRLTDLNLSGLDSLTSLYCFKNEFSVCELDRMFASLPTKAVADNAKIYIADGSISNDTLNRCKTPFANGKNWKVVNLTGNRTIANTTFSCNATAPQSFTFKSSGTSFKLNSYSENMGDIIISPALPNGNTLLSIGTNYTIEAGRTYTVTSAFTKLYLRDNYLTELNVTAMTNLTELGFQFNSLTNVDVSTLTQLPYLDCSHNKLTQLNLNGLSKLETIWANNNRLTGLNLSGLDSLIKVCCFKNQFSVCDLDRMFTSLPTKVDADNAKIYIADGSIANDTLNRCKTPIANGKNWKVVNLTGNRTIANTTFSCDEDMPSAIRDIHADMNNTDKVYGLQGKIQITPSQTGIVSVFDIVGREQLRTKVVQDQAIEFPFAVGLYIVKTQNGVYKVMVR